MSENVKISDAQPEANLADNTQTNEQEIFIPVKFNKQILNLNLEKAQELAQKGMKFDLISKDYEALKKLALADKKSVSEYISALESQSKAQKKSELLEKCGENKELAEYVLQLENSKTQDVKGFAELQESFPDFKSVEDLPESVLEAASLKGTLLLDEYLRYLHNQEVAMKSSIKTQREASYSATGSMMNKKGHENPETIQFLKGLWNK